MGRKVMFLLMVGLGVVRGWDTGNAETKKPPTPFQEAAVGSGRLILFGGFLPPHIG